jgi:hypothetical protein
MVLHKQSASLVPCFQEKKSYSVNVNSFNRKTKLKIKNSKLYQFFYLAAR